MSARRATTQLDPDSVTMNFSLGKLSSTPPQIICGSRSCTMKRSQPAERRMAAAG
jgi:hypothetical protein